MVGPAATPSLPLELACRLVCSGSDPPVHFVSRPQVWTGRVWARVLSLEVLPLSLSPLKINHPSYPMCLQQTLPVTPLLQPRNIKMNYWVGHGSPATESFSPTTHFSLFKTSWRQLISGKSYEVFKPCAVWNDKDGPLLPPRIWGSKIWVTKEELKPESVGKSRAVFSLGTWNRGHYNRDGNEGNQFIVTLTHLMSDDFFLWSTVLRITWVDVIHFCKLV